MTLPVEETRTPAHTGPDGPEGPDGPSEDLWAAVTAGDEFAAADLAAAALDGGTDAEDLLVDVIAPLQARVGAEWAAGRFTVAQEHAATAIIERVIGALAHHPAVRERREARAGERPGRIAVACIDGEWHALPARLVAEVLRLRGWRVDFLGAQVPTPHLVSHLHRTGPVTVALSSSLAPRLPAAHAAVSACRATGTPVLAGGAAFGPGGRYAAPLGADAWAPDARAAADLLEDGPPPVPSGRPADGLPHLADQEFTRVSRTAPQLVRQVVDGLRVRYPQMADYDERQLRHTAEDVAHIVDFLGAALYVDDPDLFTGFAGWTAGILTARGVPAAGLLPALDLLAEQLTDFPRAVGMLARGHAAVRDAA